MQAQSAPRPRRLDLVGGHGNALTADLYAPAGGQGPLALLVHGGGQTRHAWKGAAFALARRGWCAVTLDQRGHGESAWMPDAAYALSDYAGDVGAVAASLREKGFGQPAVVGASLGGMAGLLAAVEPGADFRALVLVDITPKVRPGGVDRIVAFMRSNAGTGFASLEEAAAAISAYLPHRPPPSDLSGLAKNLRLGDDGRYRWHWDPRFLDASGSAKSDWNAAEQRLTDAALRIRIPVLLVRGRESELVGEREAEAFRALVPHAKVADVGGARHMVAGDRNDAFTDAVLDFLEKPEVLAPA